MIAMTNQSSVECERIGTSKVLVLVVTCIILSNVVDPFLDSFDCGIRQTLKKDKMPGRLLARVISRESVLRYHVHFLDHLPTVLDLWWG